MLVFPYLRVSTAEQAKTGISIGTQKKRLTDFFNSQGWELHDFYIDDGRSAKDLNRDELQRLMADISAIERKDKVVLVLKLDRLTRSVKDLYKLLQVFEEHDTAFRSATEIFDTTTAMGRLFITIVAAMAQWERETTQERVSLNMEQMVMDGKWHGGISAYGIGWDEEDKKLYDIETESRVVRLMYKLYCYGDDKTLPLGDAKLARWLNKRGYRTRRGEPWSNSTVRYILTNPIYIQKYRWNYTSDGEYFEIKSNDIPRIMEDEPWHYAQALRKKRAGMHPKQATGVYPFSGVVKCGRCGSGMMVATARSKGNKYIYYECRQKRSGLCNLPKISVNQIEQQFLNKVSQYRDHNAALEAATAKGDDNEDNEERALRRELKKIKERRKKWQLAYANDAISLDDLRDRTAEDKLREIEVRSELEAYSEKEPKPQYPPEELAKLLTDFETQWTNASLGDRKSLLQILVKSITVNTPYDNLRNLKFEDRKIEVEGIEFN